jgi:hypothetical protein
MQFRVPQNITMEDRIIGSLTAIQFGILVIGGGFSFFVITSTSIPTPLNFILGGLLALLVIVFAIGKFNDQPMYRFFRYLIAFVFTPKTRIWHKGGADPILVKPSSHANPAHQNHAVKNVSKHDFERLAALVDSRGQTGGVPTVPTPVEKPKH